MSQFTSLQAIFCCALLAIVVSSCGVKGKPLPPLEPASIGRGAPTYKGTAAEARAGIRTAPPQAGPQIAPQTATPTPSPKSEGK